VPGPHRRRAARPGRSSSPQPIRYRCGVSGASPTTTARGRQETHVHHTTNGPTDTNRDAPPSTAAVPPVPAWLAHRPTIGGLVVPFITPRTDDGRHLFGGVDPHRQRRCLTGRLCGVCGRALVEQPGDRLILLMRLSDLPHQRTSEPALDPVCAAYTQTACPMVDLREFAISEAPLSANSSAVGHHQPA
jgi:hypothetical protein